MSIVSEIIDPLEDFPWWAILIGLIIALVPIIPLVYFFLQPDAEPEEVQKAREF